jgi:hypothetical protein
MGRAASGLQHSDPKTHSGGYRRDFESYSKSRLPVSLITTVIAQRNCVSNRILGQKKYGYT